MKSKYDATLDLETPSIFTFGLDLQATDELDIYFNHTYTQWRKSLKELVVKTDLITSTTALNYQDTNLYALGASYKVMPNLTLRAGVAMENGVALDAYRTPRTPDADRKIYSAGVGYFLEMFNTQLDLAYAMYDIENNKIDLTVVGRGHLTADVEAKAHVLMLTASMAI